MVEISFDFGGHRYAVRHNKNSKTLSYMCDYRLIDVATFKSIIIASKRDTSLWRKQLQLV